MTTTADLEDQNARGKLPDGWRRIELGELCNLVNGDAYRDTDWSTSGVPIIRIQNLNDAMKPFNHWAGPVDDRVVVRTGDVLLAWSGTPGTSFGTHRWNRGSGVLNQHIFRVDLDLEQVDPDWAVFAINEQLEEMIGKAHGGVGLRHVTRGEVENLAVLMPPLGEQTRIARILAKQMAAVESARRSAEAQLQAVEALPAAYVRAVFNNAESKSWPHKRLSDVCVIVPGRHIIEQDHNRHGEGIPYLTGPSDFGLRQASATRWTLKPDVMCEPCDVLVTVKGAGVAKMNFAPDKSACIGRQLMAVRCIRNVSKHDYIFFALHSVQDQLRKQAMGATVPGLSIEHLANLEIPVPPFEIQRLIGAKLLLQMASAERLRQTLAEQLDPINKLPAVLLRRAFKGEV